MLTAGQLARRCGISRTALLYYEKERLLSPATRGANGYRYFDDSSLDQLQRIRAYRDYGLPIEVIRGLLADPGANNDVLQRHFMRLEDEIHKLRKQQQALMALLGERDEGKAPITKERWVAIMRSAGLNDAEMQRWHQEFERMEPEGHAFFLTSIGCTDSEVAEIRRRSRSKRSSGREVG